MKHLLFIELLIFSCLSAFSNNTDSLLITLNKTIDKQYYYEKIKYQHINHLSKIVSDEKYKNNPEQLFNLYHNIYNEYKSFIYDSAFNYALKLQKLASRMHDKSKIAISKLDMGFVLLSSGLFKEALDSLKTINANNLPYNIKAQYYATLGRCYYDIANYDLDKYYSPRYDKLGNKYMDSAINLCPKNSATYLAWAGLQNMKIPNIPKAQLLFEQLISQYKLNYPQYAIATSSLAYIYLNKQQTDKSMAMLIKASIADIKSSTKETVAIQNLAEILYKHGHVQEAFNYIKVALEEATFYDARFRKNQIVAILPIIEGHELNIVEKQKKQLIFYSTIITTLSLIIIVFLFLLFRQLKKLKSAKNEILVSNRNLALSNSKLMESNKIKEEYIAHFFDAISKYINRLEKLKLSIGRKITTHQMDDIVDIISAIDIKKEKDDFYKNFDSIFLKIFPDFVNEFNSFLKEEIIIPDSNQLLTPEVRIYALIRLGFSDNDKIAMFLGYSLNTIYAYKTKIRKLLNIPVEEFERKLMKIRTV